MTNRIVYVGSANYSEESSSNTEFGFISRDEGLIAYITSVVLSDLQTMAIPYYEYDYTALLLEANVVLSAIYNIKNELYEEVYKLHDDVDGKWYYYVECEASLEKGTLDKAVQIIDEACKVASDIYDAIDTITGSDERTTAKINGIYENLLILSSKIKEIRGFDTLIELSEFDSEKYINQQLQNEYAMEAYEDNLENCIEHAMNDTANIILDLTQGAREDIDELLRYLQKFCEVYSTIIENLRVKEIKKVNPKIDNT